MDRWEEAKCNITHPHTKSHPTVIYIPPPPHTTTRVFRYLIFDACFRPTILAIHILLLRNINIAIYGQIAILHMLPLS